MLEEDEPALRKLAKSTRDANARVRYLALHALSIHKPVSLVAEIFCVDPSSLYNWILKWKEQGNLEDDFKPGRPVVLSEEQKQEIRNLVEENNPKGHGINASAWDTKELRRYFGFKGEKVSREVIRKALHELGAKYVKATLAYAEANRAEQEEFARRFVQASEQNQGKALIFFEDEMSAGCSARKGYGWTFGDRLVVKAPQRSKKRVNCFGAVNPFNGEVAEMSSGQAKAPAFIRFLQTKLLDRHPSKKIIVYLDKGPVHRAKEVQRFLKKNPKLELRFLPSYSPDLNPVEHWWGYKRLKFLNNRSFESPHHISLAMASFARQTDPQTIMDVCSLEPLHNLLR
jgi:transposase